MPFLETSHLSKSYPGIQAIDDLSFSVEAGETFALLGPNGSGKSTTLMMLAGLAEPDSGRIEIDGESMSSHPQRLRRILGIVPQNLAVYLDLTARQNLDFFGGIYGLDSKSRRRRSDYVLELAGLGDRADDLVHTYSGGMKRRLNLGIALLHEPRLLILDEPTVGVDPESRARMLNSIRELSRSGMTIVYASHYMEEVQAICGRAAILNHGRLVAYGKMGDLLSGRSGQVEVVVSSWRPEAEAAIEGLGQVEVTAAGTVRILLSMSATNGTDDWNRNLQEILRRLDGFGVHVRSIDTHELNLEGLLLELTETEG